MPVFRADVDLVLRMGTPAHRRKGESTKTIEGKGFTATVMAVGAAYADHRGNRYSNPAATYNAVVVDAFDVMRSCRPRWKAPR